ncbi:MAG TPA: zf-HC2 domain-containing protein [Gammaproteobacteria bacterium]
MNCETFNDRLDDWLDDELKATDARALQVHAAECPACHAQMTIARRLQREAFALPMTNEPARDLWPEIAARLEPRGMQGNRKWLHALAASVAVVAVFAGGMLASRVLLQGDADIAPRLVERSQQTELPSLADARRILPASYVELIDAAAPANASGTEQALLRNLLLVNLAIRDIETAMSEDPANADLRELLTGLYAQENRILAQAERMRAARPAPVRTTI